MRRSLIAFFLALGSLAPAVVPGPAAADQDVCFGQGTMQTGPLFYPGIQPANWVGFAMQLSPGAGTCVIRPWESMSGVITGHCYSASGWGTTASGHNFRFLWQGNTFVMGAGLSGLSPGVYLPPLNEDALLGTGDITPDFLNGQSCLTGATRFIFTGTWAAPTHSSSPPPPPNNPPYAPTLVAPVPGHRFAPTDTQQFTIQTSDPDNDGYIGRIRVFGTTSTAPLATYFTPRTASGSQATAVAVPPLPAGSYTWVADASDDAAPARFGQASAPAAFTVASPVPPLPTPVPPYPSETCAGGTVHEDGYVGGTYTRLHTKQPSPGTTAVCFRSEAGGVGIGGKVTFASGSTPSPGVPGTDTNASLCATTSGNVVPPPHPVFSGSVGDPADPSTYVPFSVDLYATAAQGWVCLTVGGVSHRVMVPVPHTGVPPSVTFETDGTASRLPPPTVNPGSASRACQGATSGVTEHVNVAGALGSIWLHTWQETSTRSHLCVRSQGTATTGGRLTIDTTGAGGVSPVVTTSATDTAACTLRVAGVDTPTTVEVRRSASLTDTSGVSFCVVAAGTRARVTLGASGSASPPQATWTADT